MTCFEKEVVGAEFDLSKNRPLMKQTRLWFCFADLCFHSTLGEICSVKAMKEYTVNYFKIETTFINHLTINN